MALFQQGVFPVVRCPHTFVGFEVRTTCPLQRPLERNVFAYKDCPFLSKKISGRFRAHSSKVLNPALFSIFSEASSPEKPAAVEKPPAIPLPELPEDIRDAMAKQKERKSSGVSRMSGFEAYCKSQTKEFSAEISDGDIEGNIPKDLIGTFFRNGPALFNLGETRLHPFDGHGYVVGVSFSSVKAKTKVSARSSYVKTDLYKKESESNSLLRRGYGTKRKLWFVGRDAFDMKPREVANVAVVTWRDQLLALGENGWPYELEPSSLRTVGQKDLGLPASSTRGAVLSPYVKVVPSSDENDNGEPNLVGYLCKPGPVTTTLDLFELAGDSTQPRRFQTHTLDVGSALFADIAASKDYVVLFQNSVETMLPQFLAYAAGVFSKAQSIQFKFDADAAIWLVPREGGPHQRLFMSPQVVTSVGNAFDARGVFRAYGSERYDRVTFDAISYDEFTPGQFDPSDPASMPRGGLFRFNVNLDRNDITRRTLCELACDFPAFNPLYATLPTRFVYVACCAEQRKNYPFQTIAKCDSESVGGPDAVIQLWTAGPDEYVSGPVFVPSTAKLTETKPTAAASSKPSPASGKPAAASKEVGGKGKRAAKKAAATEAFVEEVVEAAVAQELESTEDAGYLLSLVFNATKNRSRVVILDAKDITKGPIASVWLPDYVPLSFRCSFVPSVSP